MQYINHNTVIEALFYIILVFFFTIYCQSKKVLYTSTHYYDWNRKNMQMQAHSN